MLARRIYFVQYAVHDPTIGRELAHRISVRSAPGQQCRLATAPAEIDFLLRTIPARLRHPSRSTELVEAFRFAPNPVEIAFPHIFEPQIGNCRRRSRAGEYVANWIDREIPLAPAVKTRDRKSVV